MNEIENVLAEWTKDASIDESNLTIESLNIPKLHSKYLTKFSHAKLKLKSLQIKRKELQGNLQEYYSGDSNDINDRSLLEKVNKEDWNRNRVLKSQVQSYVETDEIMININLKIAYQQELVDVLEEILKSINTRNFVIKNANDFMRLTIGG